MQTEFSYNYRINKLTKFIKNLKNYICSLDPTPSIYKILRSNSLYLSYTRKRNF
jgi:hypothetical protein